MIVIHPKDKTTAMLSALYGGLEAQVVADNLSTKEMGHLLHHVSTHERIMLLGHGSDKGLFFRKDDSKDEFDKIIVRPFPRLSSSEAWRQHCGCVVQCRPVCPCRRLAWFVYRNDNFRTK